MKSVDVLRQRVSVIINSDKDEKEIRDYSVEELEFAPSKKKEKAALAAAQEEDKELKKLEE